MTKSELPDITSELIIDQIYDIAIEPEKLDTFIETWNAAGFDAERVRRNFEKIVAFDTAFSNHLNRAETFLARHDQTQNPPLNKALAPFGSSAAMVINQQLMLEALNEGAAAAFGVNSGDAVEVLPLTQFGVEYLRDSIRKLLSQKKAQDRLLNLELAETGRQVLFHLRQLSAEDSQQQTMVLIVTSQYHWQPALGSTLEEIFLLTQAELGVVQGLVEGDDVKSIAKVRGTSESTVRAQIKSILSKMNAHSQTEVIRLVMSLRDVISKNSSNSNAAPVILSTHDDRFDAESRKPFNTLTLPDGRRLDYHDQGPRSGAPILFSHMGYGQLRWSKSILKLAYQHGLRGICPIRAGYGQSDNIHRDDDVLKATREDSRFLLDHLGIESLPYVVQGNDLLFAVDFAAEYPQRISEIIGICARPYLPGDQHYSSMGKWHRFFLSTAHHSPHLLFFTVRAAFSLARKIGAKEMYKNMNRRSAADLQIINNPEMATIMLKASEELIVGENTDAAQAYYMEVLCTESDWSERIIAAKNTPIWSVNGAEDPALDASVIAAYRSEYPWIEFEILQNAGQMAFFQHPQYLIPRIAKAALRAREN